LKYWYQIPAVKFRPLEFVSYIGILEKAGSMPFHGKKNKGEKCLIIFIIKIATVYIVIKLSRLQANSSALEQEPNRNPALFSLIENRFYQCCGSGSGKNSFGSGSRQPGSEMK